MSGALARTKRPTRQNRQNRRFTPCGVAGLVAGCWTVGSGGCVTIRPVPPAVARRYSLRSAPGRAC